MMMMYIIWHIYLHKVVPLFRLSTFINKIAIPEFICVNLKHTSLSNMNTIFEFPF